MALRIYLAGLLIVAASIFTNADFVSRKPLRKTWWAKRISESLYVAGRLSDIQIKYASEDGFQSVISVYNHSKIGYFGSKQLVTTIEARDIAVRLSGLDFDILCPNDNHNEDDLKDACWRKKETVVKFGEIFSRVKKPVILYSNTGYSATFIALAWLVWQTELGKVDDADYQTSAEHFYVRASGLGYDFSQEDDLKKVIEQISNGQWVKCPAKPNLTKPDWHKIYWWAKPVEKNWYIAGQIWSDHLELIKRFNPDVLLNSRRGATYIDPTTKQVSSTQEEVTLLNVNENCRTYQCSGGRQSQAQLEANRIDPTKTAEYISSNNTSGLNYMTRNPLEFGDHIGYNETIERGIVADIFNYVHTPLGGPLGYHEGMFNTYIGTWTEAHKRGNVFLHCRTGYRAVIPVLMTIGTVMDYDMDWAVEKAKLIGYTFKESTDASVLSLFRIVFNNTKSSSPPPSTNCPENDTIEKDTDVNNGAEVKRISFNLMALGCFWIYFTFDDFFSRNFFELD